MAPGHVQVYLFEQNNTIYYGHYVMVGSEKGVGGPCRDCAGLCDRKAVALTRSPSTSDCATGPSDLWLVVRVVWLAVSG